MSLQNGPEDDYLAEVDLEVDLWLRQNLKKNDDDILPESGIYFEALEARIMGALDAAIEAGDVKEHGGLNVQGDSEKAAASVLAQDLGARSVRRSGPFVLFLGTALILIGKSVLAPLWAKQVVSVSPAVLLGVTRAAAPEVLAESVLSFESSSDLAIEIAARRLVAHTSFGHQTK